MSMLGGAVSIEQTINPDGSFVDVETTSGLAGALYASIKASNLDKYNETMAQMDEAIAAERPQLSETTTPKLSEVRAQLRQSKAEISLATKQGWAKQANELGPPMVAYLQEHARVPLASVVATVSTSTSTGRTPNPNDPNTAIQGPSAAVELPVTGEAGAVELPLL